MQNLSDEILKAIKYAIDKKVVKCDRTFQSVIKYVTKKGYVILDETGSERTVQCCIPGVRLKTGDKVLVKIPNGDLKQIHIAGIYGKSTGDMTATRIGTATVGNARNPVYVAEGIPVACSSTVGSAAVPVYMNNGTITVCNISGLTYSANEPSMTDIMTTWIDAE